METLGAQCDCDGNGDGGGDGDLRIVVLYALRVWLGRIKLEMARTASRLLGCPGAWAWALGAGAGDTSMCVCVCLRVLVPVCVCVCVGCVSRGSADGSRYQEISGSWQGQ